MAKIKLTDIPKDQMISEKEIKTITGGFTTFKTLTSSTSSLSSQTSLNPFNDGGSIVAVAGVRG
jgi:hypothetical protein